MAEYHFEEESSCDEEELQLELDEKCNDIVELEAELRASKIEVQQLQLRLRAAMSKSGSARPAAACMPSASPSTLDHKVTELQNLFTWLAKLVELACPEVLTVNFQVPVGGRSVHLQRVKQWLLKGSPGCKRLRLSVPVEHKEEIAAIIAEAQHKGEASREAAAAFAAAWDLVPGELMTTAHPEAEPAVLLAHRASTQGVLIATWPTREALEAFHAQHATNCDAPRIGDRVEVEYEGQWYTGILYAVEANGRASVRCDVDAPGVLTIAPLQRVRRLRHSAEADNTGKRRVFSEEAVTDPNANGTSPAPALPPCGTRPNGMAHRRTRSAM